MSDRFFDWDAQKSQLNFDKHGIQFQLAIRAFDDPHYIEEIDDREEYGEERVKLTGMVDGELITLIYTEREGYMRIISARWATRRETDAYYQSNSQG